MKKFLMFGVFAILLSFGVAFLAGCGAPVNIKYMIKNGEWCTPGIQPPVLNLYKDSTGNYVINPKKGVSNPVWPFGVAHYTWDTSKPVEYGQCYDSIQKKYVNMTTSAPA